MVDSHVILDKLITSYQMGNEDIKISLFVVSKKHPGLKKLDLQDYSIEDRAKKLHQWGQEHRFVAVIEMGDKMFVHAHAKHADSLEKQRDLAIGGKKVDVKTLTDEEAEQLTAVARAFENYVESEDNKKTNEEKARKEFLKFHNEVQDTLAHNQLISDKEQMAYIIGKMDNIPGKVKLDFFKKVEEERLEEEKRKEADEKKDRIKKQEIQKEILRSEIVKEEVKQKASRTEDVSADVKRHRRRRGEEI